jgi:hypothetical protein
MVLVAVMPVAAMVKQVHQWARKKEEIGQRTHHVRRVLGEQIEERDGQEAERRQTRRAPP